MCGRKINNHNFSERIECYRFPSLRCFDQQTINLPFQYAANVP